MKILRRHCGFTTNSSAASEWVSGPIGPTTPPGWKPPVPAAPVVPAVPAVPGQEGAPAAPSPSVAPSAPTPVQPAGATSASETTPVGARPSLLMDNLAVLGGLLLAVLGILAVERLIRRRLRRRSQDDV